MRKIIGGLIIGACALEIFSPSYVQSQDGSPFRQIYMNLDDASLAVIMDTEPAADAQYAAFWREKRDAVKGDLRDARVEDYFVHIMEGVLDETFAANDKIIARKYAIPAYCQAIADASPKDAQLSYVPPLCREYQLWAWRAKANVTLTTSLTP